MKKFLFSASCFALTNAVMYLQIPYIYLYFIVQLSILTSSNQTRQRELTSISVPLKNLILLKIFYRSTDGLVLLLRL